MNDKAVEQDILQTIQELEEDLKNAKGYLALWRKRNAATPQREAPAKTSPKASLAPEYGAVKVQLLKAIELCPLDYSVRDIEKVLNDLGSPIKREAIQQGVSRMAAKGELIIHKKGAGPNPAIYRKQSQTTN